MSQLSKLLISSSLLLFLTSCGAEAEKEKAQKEANRLRDENAQLKTNGDELTKTIAQNNQSITDLQQKLADSDRNSVKEKADMQTQLTAANEKLENLKAQLNRTMDDATKAESKLQEQIDQKQAEIEKLTKKGIESASKVAELSEQKRALEAELAKQSQANQKTIAELNQKVIALEGELASRPTQQQLERLNNELAAANARIADLNAKIESTASGSNSEAELKKVREELEAEKQKVVQLEHYRGVITRTMDNLWGLYLTEKPVLTVDNSPCHLFTHVGKDGSVTRAISCENGKIQWERQNVLSFDAGTHTTATGLRYLGIKMSTSVSKDSCKELASVSKGESIYDFSSRVFEGEDSPLGASINPAVGVTFAGKGKELRSAAQAKLGSADCDNLLADGAEGNVITPRLKSLLTMAQLVCKVARDVKPEDAQSGCFVANDAFTAVND